MKKILLITPPCIDLYRGIKDITYIERPLGLLYIASFLKKNNIEVEIYDSFAEDASMDEIEKKISLTKANVIGITSMTSVIREAVEIAEIAKKYGKTTVLGGIHITATPITTLKKHKCFDYGIVGEGELTLYELIDGKNTKEIDGLVYRNGDDILLNKRRELIKDLDILPHPIWHLLKDELYRPTYKFFAKRKKFFTMITSRGCPNQCTFCASKVMWGTKVRFRPIDDVLKEIDELKKEGMEQLRIIDDTFTLKIDRVKAISNKLKSLNIEWGCSARADCFTPEIAKILGDNNCRFVEFGIESGNQRILDSIKKGITLEQVRVAVKLAKKNKINVLGSFILGHIGETKETIEDTIQFAKELNPHFAQFGMLTAYPGTEVYEIAKEKGYLTKDFEDYKNPKFIDSTLNLPTISSKEVERYCKKAYREFYLNPKYITMAFYQSLISLSELKRNFKFLTSFIKLFKISPT